MSEQEKQPPALQPLDLAELEGALGTCGVDGCGPENLEEATAGSPKHQVILPGSTIGILGGGQLGRMMAGAGSAMGYRFVALDPTPDAPCGQVAEQIVAAYDDHAAAAELAQRADVITYEFENVDADVAAMLAKTSYVPQGSELLYTTQHRLREKRAIEAAGVRVAPYSEIGSVDELRAAVGRFGLPCVLKTATGGYDGKGQWVIRSESEVEEAYETLSLARTELVLEKFIAFDKELSVIAARSPQGEIRTFPISENVHVDNILHLSIVPARVDEAVGRKAQELASRIAEGLGVVGLVAVELFLTAEGELFVNELAPRPHNSGHYTMEACRTSQFEQHVRAVCGLPLGDPALLTPVVMVNVLGEHMEPLLERMARPDDAAERLNVAPKVHLYGKHEAKHKRKMGHVNVLAKDVDTALAWIAETNIWRF
ncbi:5-(carboxyamino)imidazole ribonucleotide synthase [Paenibacillus nasutitermitis]|uniref:N5-carboxyaminoimidazole ribonucleotide synthase n=1 Tax=Paenibacillus nasutitermitis TaxID=1652958 RepID=A0A916ZC90_9BACL|nr:5-(carboxyamino)imidazole ribonucleotide synthase [Paenibacillus nasutitermitis]GGD87937.1 N5-carboxyaminoimidazole ribonucleotide synthase [Paenibacillus nasutitermitis]